MFTYQQSTGTFSGSVQALGYSGHGDGLNNPAMQNVEGIGPIPQGSYTIGPPTLHPKLGPIAMELDPDDDNEMFGRSGFFLHGDNAAMNHTASDGCIILDHETRLAVADAVANGDNRLEVTT